MNNIESQLIEINSQKSFIGSSNQFSFREIVELTKNKGGKCRKTSFCSCDFDFSH